MSTSDLNSLSVETGSNKPEPTNPNKPMETILLTPTPSTSTTSPKSLSANAKTFIPHEGRTKLQSPIHSQTKLRFCTYNVLSSKLCKSSDFKDNNPKHLNPSNRFDDICAFLKQEIDQGPTIFGLQEVSLEWKSQFLTFFKTFGYEFYCASYGNHWNGFMGVALAYPSAIQVQNIQEYIPSQQGMNGYRTWKQNQSSKPSIPSRTWSFIKESMPFQNVIGHLLKPKHGEPVQKMAIERYNRVILATVICPYMRRAITVAVYHMPCKFQYPYLMGVYAAFLKSCVAQYSYNHYTYGNIVLTDFNSQPGSIAHQVMTHLDPIKQSDMDKLSEISPGLQYQMDGLNDRYNTTHDPKQITTFAKGFTGQLFHGTLDYIFYSHHLKLIPRNTLPVISTDNISTLELMPNSKQPSDHYPLIAQFA